MSRGSAFHSLIAVTTKELEMNLYGEKEFEEENYQKHEGHDREYYPKSERSVLNQEHEDRLKWRKASREI